MERNPEHFIGLDLAQRAKTELLPVRDDAPCPHDDLVFAFAAVAATIRNPLLVRGGIGLELRVRYRVRMRGQVMIESYRSFTAGPDPFGAKWEVDFRWAQNAISIRHADTVDVKFEITSGDIHEEKIVALPLPALTRASRETNHPVTDPWCHRIAAAHLKKMIETGEDVEKTLVTLDFDSIRAYAEAQRPAEIESH